MDESPSEIDDRKSESENHVRQFQCLLENQKQSVDHQQHRHDVMQQQVGYEIPALQIGEVARTK